MKRNFGNLSLVSALSIMALAAHSSPAHRAPPTRTVPSERERWNAEVAARKAAKKGRP